MTLDFAAPSADELHDKAALYQLLVEQAKALVYGQRSWVTNCANVSALVYHALRDRQLALGHPTSVNWVGFYVRDSNAKPGQLVLGPFQGRVACTVIPKGKGVCGAAAETRRVQLVPDVHAFPGHIACDSKTNSEVVLPVLAKDGSVIGVFDLDCEAKDGFDEEDVHGLQQIVDVLVEGCEWQL